jgi:gas vesicle protein
MADEGGGKFTYFLAGLGVGTLIGILFAPRSGEETRNLIQTRVDEGRDYLTKRSHELREQADDLIERGRKAVARQRENVHSAVEAGRQAYREASAREAES